MSERSVERRLQALEEALKYLQTTMEQKLSDMRREIELLKMQRKE